MADSARRIQRDVRKLERDPPDLVLGFGLQAKSKWLRVALQGPPETPYDRGVYIVQIDIPAHYPHKAPKIKVLTPSGRFETQKQICVDGLTSMHEESWNPLQTFNSICIAFVSFMSEDVVGYAGIKRSAAERRALPARSDALNEEGISGPWLRCHCPGNGEQHRHQQLRRAAVGPPRYLLCPAWSPSTAGLPEQM